MKKILGFFAILIPIVAVIVVIVASRIVGSTVTVAVTSIDLNTGSGSVSIGTSKTLEYTVYPIEATNRRVTFTSSDQTVAIVDQSGTVSFVGFGEVNITATTVDGAKSKVSTFFVVSDSVYGINLYADKKEVGIGETVKLIAEVFPSTVEDKRIYFTSLDETVATVDSNGNVTALNCGEVTVIASAGDGTVSQSLVLEVTQKADSVRLIADNTVTQSGYIKLTAEFSPAFTSEKYKNLTFTGSNNNVATVTNDGTVVFLTGGYVDITATTDYGVANTVRLFNTDGLPSEFSIAMPSTLYKTFDETNNNNNKGQIKLNLSDNSYNRHISYTSSNENVVSVSPQGSYQIKGGGISTVKVTCTVAVVKNNELVIEEQTKQFDIEVARYITNIKVLSDVFINGDTYNITASYLPSDATVHNLNYESLNQDIASVDGNGKVVFLTAGKADVLITAQGGATAAVSIVSGFNFPVSASVAAPLMELNKTYALNPVFTPATAYAAGEWSSLDTSIATVNGNGVVTPVALGETVITFEYLMFDTAVNQTKKQKVLIPITVYSRLEQIAAYANLDKRNNVYCTANASFAVLNTLFPQTASIDRLEYLSDNNKIADIDTSGRVIFKTYGICTFTVRAYSVDGTYRDSGIQVEYSNGVLDCTVNGSNNLPIYIGDFTDVQISSVLPSDCEDTSYSITQSGDLFIINGNRITAKKAGTCTISVNFKNGFKKSFDITVNQQIKTINLKSDVDGIGRLTFKKSVRIYASVLPENAFNKQVEFSSSDQSIATVDATGKVEFLRAGVVTIYAVAKDGYGASGQITVESSFGKVLGATLDNEIIINSYAGCSFIPNDAVDLTLNFEIVSQTSDIAGEQVVQVIGGRLYGTGIGTAIIKLTATTAVNNIETVQTVGVQLPPDVLLENFGFVNGNVFITQGDTFDLFANITDFYPISEDILEVYLKYITPIYSISYPADAKGLEITEGILVAAESGVYEISIVIDGIEKFLSVSVFNSSDNVEYEDLDMQSVTESENLCWETEVIQSNNVTVFTTNHKEIPLPVVNVENVNPSFVSRLSFVSGEESVAYIDNGNLVFIKSGIVRIDVYQSFAASRARSVSGCVIDSLYFRYYDTVQSFDVELNGVLLSKTEKNIINFSNQALGFEFKNVFPKPSVSDYSAEIIASVPNVEAWIVLSVSGKDIYTVSGGTAKIAMTKGTLTSIYTVEVRQPVDSILPLKDICTSDSVVSLPKPSILPLDATDKTYTYSCSDASVATVNGNILTFSAAGKVIVTVTAADAVQTTFEVKSTYGGFIDFTANDMVISKNQTADFVINPDMGSISGVTFNISVLSQTSNVGDGEGVVQIADNRIKGLKGGVAVIEISADNAFGQKINKTVNVEVIERVSDMRLSLSNSLPDLDTNGRLITSLKSITVFAEILPVTATNRNIIFNTSNPAIAEVSDAGVVTFKQAGNVIVTVTSADNLSVTERYEFRYVGNNAYSVTIGDIPRTMQVGENFSIDLIKIIPQDMVDITYNVSVLRSAPNIAGGTVLTANNGTVSAVEGGSAVIKISVNNYEFSETDITVRSPIKAINCNLSISLSDFIYNQGRTYQLLATYTPSHADNTLAYKVLSGDGVSVSAAGLVTLPQFGIAVIRIYSSIDESVFKDVTFTYSEYILQSIDVENKPTVIFGGSNYSLTVVANYSSNLTVYPQNAVFENLNPELIDITQSGEVTAKNNIYGHVTIKVSYGGKTCQIGFTVAPVISYLGFELNNAEDNRGIKGERVFGTQYFTGSNPASLNEVVNTYKMNFNTNTVIPANTPLVWSSSDTAKATVTDDGVVTFLSPGTVTVSCQPKYQYSSECARFEFKLVKGINVYNIAQYEVFTKYYADNTGIIDATNVTPAVLHTDINYTSAYVANFWYDSSTPYRTFRAISNLYGNGYTIDVSGGKQSSYSGAIGFQIYQSNVLIDNVTLIGATFNNPSVPNLADLEGKNITLAIRGYGNGYALSSVVVANSTIMNGKCNVEAYASQFKLTGCIIKNAYQGNVILNTFTNLTPTVSSDATLKNCVVENSLTPSIDLKVDKKDIPADRSNKLTIEGNLYLNNWRRKADIPKGLDLSISTVLKEIFDKLIKDKDPVVYNGEYINMGISRISLTGGGLIGKYINYGTVTEYLDYLQQSSMSKYVAVAGNATIILDTYHNNNIPTLPGMDGPILPGTQITSTVYPYIRDVGV